MQYAADAAAVLRINREESATNNHMTGLCCPLAP
jgi:hypothetical protein